MDDYKELQFESIEAEEIFKELLKIPGFHINFDASEKISVKDLQFIKDLIDKI